MTGLFPDNTFRGHAFKACPFSLLPSLIGCFPTSLHPFDPFPSSLPNGRQTLSHKEISVVPTWQPR
ncbi:MAG: hypothetical protein LKKZDAJK_001729 [Candidatus Fervidibacter sp.]